MIFRFKQFSLDSQLHQLLRGRKLLAIRPKTTQVLCHLLENRQRVVSKRELLAAVWGHDCAEDHALFQLVSEIRQLLGDKDCIKTLPNRGYRWVWPVKTGARPVWMGTPLAAGFGLAAMLLGIWLWPASGTLVPTELQRQATLTSSPAMGALARGIELRAQGDTEQARVYFEVAVAANPQFAAAKLELAQTLQILGQYQQAQRHAYDALSDARIVGDAYLEATAHIVLSQLRWLAGDLAGAIELNSRAAKIANEQGRVCAAQVSAVWQQQLTLAIAQPGNTELPPFPESTLSACVDALSIPRGDSSGMFNPGPVEPAVRRWQPNVV